MERWAEEAPISGREEYPKGENFKDADIDKISSTIAQYVIFCI